MLGVDTVFGLPVHALVVHFAVVLVPLAATGVLVTAWKSDWRQRYMLPLALIAVIGAGAAIVAASSGETLEHTVRTSAEATGASARFGDHPEQGNQAEILSIAFALGAVGLYSIEEPFLNLKRFGLTDLHTKGVIVICCVLAVLALISMIVAGHSGATLVWKDLGNFVKSG